MQMRARWVAVDGGAGSLRVPGSLVVEVGEGDAVYDRDST
jgi:hypothetical protein